MSSAPPSAAPPSVTQSLQQLQTQCGNVYESYAPSSQAAGDSKKAFNHRERSRLQNVAEEHVGALCTQCVSSKTKSQLSPSEFEQLVRLLPSLAVLSAPAASQSSLVLLVNRLFHPQPNDSPTPHLDDAVTQGVLCSLAGALHHPEAWAAGGAAEVLAIRATASGLIAQLLRFFVAHAQEAAVEAQWRQWQNVAANALLSNVQAWVEAAAARRTQASAGAAPHARTKAAAATSAQLRGAEWDLCQLVDLVDAVVEHPCARSLPGDAWPPVLACVADLAGPPQRAPQHLALTYAVLQVLVHVRGSGVVSPGVWRQLTLEMVARSVPRGPADAPDPVPVSPFSAPSVTYAALFLKYVHVTKSLMLLGVEESSTDSNTARDTAAQLHAVVAGLVELSATVFIEKPASSADSAEAPSTGQVSLLAAVVKDLLSVRAESRSAPRQYARYVQGMLAGSTPLVPFMVRALATECLRQAPLLGTPGVASVLATNMEILQGVFLWSIHVVLDEGLLDATRRSAVAASLPWMLYDLTDAALSQMSERLASVLLTNPLLVTKKSVPVLAVRAIACEGLALLLHFVLFVVAPYGITDEVSWNVRFRDRLSAAETRVMRTVSAFDCGLPQVLQDFVDGLDRMSGTLGPTAAKVSALLPNSTRPSLASAGCHGALDKLYEVIPIF